jgi:hypothetical protein
MLGNKIDIVDRDGSIRLVLIVPGIPVYILALKLKPSISIAGVVAGIQSKRL